MNYGGGYDSGYQTTSYGGGGGGGGGGFLSGSQSASQASPGKSPARNTVRPVTIKQIIDAASPHDDTTFLIDNNEIGQITFVAQIRSVTAMETNTTYKMEDGTGSIEVKQFVTDKRGLGDDDDGATREPPLTQDMYARVIGNMKQFNGKRHVGTHFVKHVTDFNEIQCHMLEATVVHLYFTRGPPDSQQAQHTAGGGNMGYQQQDTAMSGTGNTGGGATLLPPGISPKAKMIYGILKNRPESSEGMHIAMIAQEAKMSSTETYKAVDELLTNGVCFTTMDDEHIACMDF